MNDSQNYRRLDLHIAWLGGIFAIVIGAGAWLGVPNAMIPMALLVISWLCAILYAFVMVPWPFGKALSSVFLTVLFCIVGWWFWNVFAVDLQVRFINGVKDPSGGEEIRFAVELTNRGKSTSLQHWRAELIDSGGNVYEGDPLRMSGETVEIEDANHSKSLYALPDCDLRFETVRAIQPGDSVYGIADFVFRGYSARPMPLDMRVRLEATDMLGRKVTSGDILFSKVDNQPRDIFPCREIKQQ